MEDEDRFIPNELVAFNGWDETNTFFTPQIIQLFKDTLTRNETKISFQQSFKLMDVYNGLAGTALTYLHRYFLDQTNRQMLTKARELYNKALESDGFSKASYEDISMLIGRHGVFTVGAIIMFYEGNTEECTTMLNKLLGQFGPISQLAAWYPHELLYGKSGYLQCLLYCKRYIPKEHTRMLNGRIVELVNVIIKHGKNFSEEKESASPLMYEWHESQYLGGAHGLSGILYQLMEALDMFPTELKTEEHVSMIRGTMDFISKRQLPSGNYPSRPENEHDRLMQWCHGAPGVIPTLLRAATFFDDGGFRVTNDYLARAEMASEAVWTYGVLTKGVGLCHGISGNAYSFLLLYMHTRYKKYLYQCVEFLKLCCNNDFLEQLKTPDHPNSLFEGRGGLVWILSDVIALSRMIDSTGNLPETLPYLDIKFPTY
ncbi:hypothetical protein SAMD00019534_063000 [Acytostelium subglobosum LB1]|uniref:hypothetical protein n=1 Tax=Acytostelium subglobosum LB1 TaxID=1410327 RepID=UPI000644984C|nr:hypothetical protein SAMD00019534_063000 [Acytostelium subglobosum LB1]GAM23125.1 hypothetical protein SAMD00019534_063000 [Acytostelium subglobosum LB1]|eukprot:XP_012753574.1 hypothetical protein SAMD00019534_063000 [Acytostelium subglobosum LB1]